MTTGEDRSKDRFKNWKLCGLCKLLFRYHGAIKLSQNCVCFTYAWINPFIPTSVTREYHPKELERLHLLQCIAAHVQNTLPWASWETQYLNLFSADFRSCLVARSRRKNDQMCTEDPVEKIHACSTNSSAKSKRFFLQFTTMTSSSVDVSVTVYPTQLDQGSPNFLGEDHISCCTAVRGPDILRKVIFWGMLHSAKSTHFS